MIKGNQGGSQFKATEFWNTAVSSVKKNVKLKDKRVKLKRFAECFSGTEVVDVAHQFLEQSKENMANKDVTREQAAKLCQLMLASHVFEPVQPKMAKDGTVDDLPADKFRDSSSKLYRFLDDLAVENEYSKDSTPVGLVASMQANASQSLRKETEMSGASVCGNLYLNDIGEEELLNITGHVKSRLSFRGLKRALTPSSLLRGKTPSSRDSCTESTKRARRTTMSARVPPEVEDEIWREVALAHLLTLVEIPILELILGYEYSTNKHNVNALTFTNQALSIYASLSSLVSDPGQDEWLDAALECLEALPGDASEALKDACAHADQAPYRHAIFTRIAAHYSALSHPLWSNNFADLHIALLNLLLQGRNDVVLKAVQLSFLLLPSSLREEITRLLMFMKLSSEDEILQISPLEGNRQCIERTLTPSVIRSKKLNTHQCSLLVMFMMDRAQLVGRCPEDTEDKIATRLEFVSQGITESPADETAYCARVTRDQYAAQQAQNTEDALVALMNQIIDDSAISLKNKKQRLQQFKVAHPVLFERHFSNLLE